MFKNLFNLSVKRSGFEIFGFYIFYSLLGAIVAGVICGVVIIKARNLFNSFRAISLLILSVPLLFFCGLSLGLVPVAFLTGFDDDETPEQKD